MDVDKLIEAMTYIYIMKRLNLQYNIDDIINNIISSRPELFYKESVIVRGSEDDATAIDENGNVIYRGDATSTLKNVIGDESISNIYLSGRFKVSDTISIVGDKIIRGNAIIIPSFNVNGNNFTVFFKDWGRHNVYIEGITIDPLIDNNPVPLYKDRNDIGSQQTTAIYIKGGPINIIRNIKIRNWGRHGIYIEGGQNPDTENIRNIIVGNNIIGSHYTSISTRDSTMTIILGNILEDQLDSDEAITSRYNSHLVIISNNIVKNTVGATKVDLTSDSPGKVVISNNVFDRVALGIHFTGRNAIISDNVVVLITHIPESGDNVIGNGITVSGSFIIIRANAIYGIDKINRGIYVGGTSSSNINITDNIVYNAGVGVFIDDGSQAYVKDNILISNDSNYRIDSDKKSFIDEVSYSVIGDKNIMRHSTFKLYENNYYKLGAIFGNELRKILLFIDERFCVKEIIGNGSDQIYQLDYINMPPASPDKFIISCSPADNNSLSYFPAVCYAEDTNSDGNADVIKVMFKTAVANGDTVKVACIARLIY